MPDITLTVGAGDAKSKENIYHLKTWHDSWLTPNSVNGALTEFGIPQSSGPLTDPIPGSGTGAKYDRRWVKCLNTYLDYVDLLTRIKMTTYWGASEWRVDLEAWLQELGITGVVTHRTTSSTPLILHPGNTGAGKYRGSNFSGGEYSDQGPNGILNRSHTDEPASGYYYPEAGNAVVFSLAGQNVMRIPVSTERLQDYMLGPLNTTEMAKLDVIIDACIANGILPIIDLHRYGRYDTIATGTGGGVYALGDNAPATHKTHTVGGTMSAFFVDFWVKLATYYKSKAVAFELMNEPNGFTGGAATWQQFCRDCTEGIRAMEYAQGVSNHWILLDGYQYASIQDWASINGSTPWMTETIPTGQTGAGSARNTDPKILFTAHQYFDPASGGYNGGYEDFYDTEVSNSAGRGFTAWAQSGYTDAYPYDITSQTGLRSTFKSSFDSQGDFGGTYDAVQADGTNVLTLPFSGKGNPGNSMKIVCSTTGDACGVKKSLTGGANGRIHTIDHLIDSSTQPNITDTFTVDHFWNGDFSADIIEIRIIGVAGGGFKYCLTVPGGTYTTVQGQNTYALGVWHTAKLVVDNDAFRLYIDGNATPEVIFLNNNTGVSIGGSFDGKYYGNQALILYYDNKALGLNATFDAPPNGGQLASITPPPPITNKRGFFGIL